MAGFKTLPKKFTSWSNSRWNDYYKCPAYAHYKHIQKLPEPKTGPMDRGIEIAKMEEAFFKGELKALPVWPYQTKVVSPGDINDPRTWPKWTGKTATDKKNGIAIHPAIVGQLNEAKKRKDLMVEQNWGFDKDWNEVDYFDWARCHLRIKVDVGWGAEGEVCDLRDNKTGKYTEYDVEKYMDQLNLYAAGAAARFPWVKKFRVQLWFTDLGIAYPEQPLEITRAAALKLQKAFTKRVQPMLNDTRFDPKPNRTCQYCHFSSKKGGPCKY